MGNVFATQLANLLQHTVITWLGIFGMILSLVGILIGVISRRWRFIGGSILGILIFSLAMPENSFLNFNHFNLPLFFSKSIAFAPTWLQVGIIVVLIVWLVVALARLIAAPWNKIEVKK